MTEPHRYETRARSVTLFEDRAEVVRDGEVEAWKGNTTIAISGVGPYIDDRSLQARITPRNDEVKVVSIRVLRRTTAKAPDRGLVESAERAEREARAKLCDAEDALARLSVRQRNVEALGDAWIEGLSRVPSAGSEVEAWGQAWTKLSQTSLESVETQTEMKQGQVEALEALGLAQMHLNAARASSPRQETLVEVQLEASSDQKIQLELSYRTPCALWRPEHLARLERADGDSAQVEIVTWATAWQITGEEWRDIELHFSTARPASAATAPLLTDDVLFARAKTAAERRSVVVDLREQSIARAGATEQTQEMPGVDDGGEPLRFTAMSRVTLPSKGEPMRFEVDRITLDAEVETLAMPEVSTSAHLRAALILSAERPLLAGPLRVARGASLVGQSKLDFVAPGEHFAIGFGSDEALTTRRTQTQTRDRVPVVGTQKVAVKTKIFLSNLSGDARSLSVKERIPVSELSSVEVHLRDAPGWVLDGEDGFLVQDVNVGPNDTVELSYRYEIRADSDVVLPF